MSIGNVEVLVIAPVTDDTLGNIAAIDGRVRVVDARGWFDVEIGETWPRWTVHRYLDQRAIPLNSREERDRAAVRTARERRNCLAPRHQQLSRSNREIAELHA